MYAVLIGVICCVIGNH